MDEHEPMDTNTEDDVETKKSEPTSSKSDTSKYELPW